MLCALYGIGLLRSTFSVCFFSMAFSVSFVSIYFEGMKRVLYFVTKIFDVF